MVGWEAEALRKMLDRPVSGDAPLPVVERVRKLCGNGMKRREVEEVEEVAVGLIMGFWKGLGTFLRMWEEDPCENE